MKKSLILMGVSFIVLLSSTSCLTIPRIRQSQLIMEPDASVKFDRDDFTLSDQVSAKALTIKFLGINFSSKKSVPMIGGFLPDRTKDRAEDNALHKLMSKNEGYDVIFYPKFATRTFKPFLGIGFFLKITNVKATARLGKLKKDSPDRSMDFSNVSPEMNRQKVQVEERQRAPEENRNNVQRQTPEVQNVSTEMNKQEVQVEERQKAPEENRNNVQKQTSEAQNEYNNNTLVNSDSKSTNWEKAYNDYIEQNRRQLTDPDCRNRHGKVILLFIVSKQGRPTNITVFRSLCQEADREAIRLLQDGPDWAITDESRTRFEINF